MKYSFDSEWDRLQTIMQSDLNAYQEDVLKPWVGMEGDLALLKGVVAEYIQKTGQGIRLVEDYHLPEDDFENGWIKVPEWVSLVQKAFTDAYGPDEGKWRFFKAQSAFLTELMSMPEDNKG